MYPCRERKRRGKAYLRCTQPTSLLINQSSGGFYGIDKFLDFLCLYKENSRMLTANILQFSIIYIFTTPKKYDHSIYKCTAGYLNIS